MEPLNQDVDEAINRWGAAAAGTDPLLASFTIEPYSAVRPHVPFYRFFSYPDILDLRKKGYEVDRFVPVFDQLDDALYSQAIRIHELLHLHQDYPNPIWNPRRAREIEFSVRAELHRFGLSDIPTLLRRMLGRAFPEDSLSHLSIDLLHAFFWAALSEVARDYAWRSPILEGYADYLAYPVRAAGFSDRIRS
jgi:hypothetical protein